jgi:hypothetical protein
VRQFSLAGALFGNTFSEMKQIRQSLIDLFNPESTPLKQPFILRYYPSDELGNVTGEPKDILSVYAGGLEGQFTNFTQDRIGLSFYQYDPLLSSVGDSATNISVKTLVPSTGTLFMQNGTTGVWSTLGVGNLNTGIMVEYYDGTILFGGNFTNILGSGVSYLARWDGANWTNFGAVNPDGQVMTILVDSYGNIYIGGAFTHVGALAVTGLAKWDIKLAQWINIGDLSGGTNIVYAMVFTPTGQIIVGGNFTSIGGVSANCIAISSTFASGAGVVWKAMGTGVPSGLVLSLGYIGNGSFVRSCGSDRVYVGGIFASIGGITTTSIAAWNFSTSAWEAVGGNKAGLVAGSFSGQVNSILVDLDGLVYVGGGFNKIGGVTIFCLAVLVGDTYSAVGGGNNTGEINYIIRGRNSDLLIGAIAVTATGWKWGGASNGFVSPIAVLRNGKLIPPPVSFSWNSVSTSITGYSAVKTRSGDYYFMNYTTLVFPPLDIVGSSSAIVTNAGTKVYPTFRIRGPGLLYEICNYTTNQKITFVNLQLLDDEVCTLETNPFYSRFISNKRGDLYSLIGSGSDFNISLNVGGNYISGLISGFDIVEYNDVKNLVSFSGITGLTLSNTDNGHIYVKTVYEAGSAGHVNIYSDSGFSTLIAHTASYSTTGSKALVADGGSGVGGTINADTIMTSTAFNQSMIVTWGPLVQSIDVIWKNKFLGIDKELT